MRVASRRKKQEKTQERRERAGWPGLVPLGDVYGFEYFLTHERPWRAAMPQRNELLRVTFGSYEIVVRFDARIKKTVVNCRWAMALFYAYDVFHKERIERMMYHVEVDGDAGRD